MSEKFALITFGCQMNDADSELVAGIFAARGWSRTDDPRQADLILMNTCVVRNTAERRAIGRLWQLKPLKEQNPALVIGVCGCLAQKDGEALLQAHPFVDLVVGTRDLGKLGQLVDETRRTGERLVYVDGIDAPVSFAAAPTRGDDLKALVTIMHGCDNACAYCVVPQTRGREWSRPAGEILDEFKQLADAGYREVTLLGQNVNSYRDGQTDFAELLARCDAAGGIERIRFTTSHPKDCGERLIEAVADLPSLCEHIHLPAQAGANRILDLMARQYTREHYLDLIEKIRARMPGAAITTDLIVGFPGETEAEFEETLDLLERARWDSAFTFVYSPRDGTPAAEMDDPTPLPEKKRWLSRLIARTEEISAEKNAAAVGTQQELLIEGPSRRSPRQAMGRTRGNKVVILDDAERRRGDIVTVEITSSSAHTLFGRLSQTNPLPA